MKIVSQHSDELTYLSQLIENIPIAMLTGPDDDDVLVSRPMAALEMDDSGALWFFTDRRSSKVEHLRAINLSFSDTGKGSYVSLSGHGEIHTDPEQIKRLWSPTAKPWFPDGPASKHMGLLKFVPNIAEYWDAPNSRMARLAAMVASVVTAQPVGLGEHGKVRTPAGNVAQR
jgi:general stress protein 26